MLRVNRIKIQDVHGYIPLDISFDKQLTFLTGSNGSGKTTILKLISAVLQPNFELLNSIKFSSLKIAFTNNQELSCLVLQHGYDIIKNNEGFYWRLFDLKKTSKKEIQELFKKDLEIVFKEDFFRLIPKYQQGIFNRDEFVAIRENVHNEFINSTFYQKIQSINNPIHLGIDRKIIGNIAQEKSKIYFGTSIYSNQRKDRSFLDAQRVVIDYVSGMADERKTLIETFKSNIFKSLFEYIPLHKSDDIFKEIDDNSFEIRKNNTLLAIKNLELSNEIASEIKLYYNSLQEIQPKVFKRKAQDREINEMNEWFINRTHLHRIEAISEYAGTYQEAIDKLDMPLKEITNIANSFLQESNKSLKIGASGKLQVVWSDQEIVTDNLSSGEMQLIVIIVHLVFCELRKESSVFVIDEPELSLHISWQEKFVDAILQASPSTQFILATHSPAIISNFEYEKKAIYIKNV
jgi:predicted ATP-dependent endonuclease of OLD family